MATSCDIEKKLLTAHQNHCHRILEQYPGVTAVDINYRQVGGTVTDERCIQVWVREKKHERHLPDHHVLPKEIDGHRVDVIQGEILSLNDHPKKPSFVEATSKGLQGGDSIGVSTGYYSGTVGCFVKKGLELGIITCAHVAEQVGNTITSPSVEDGGKPPATDIGKAITVLKNENIDGAYVKLDKPVPKYQLKNGTIISGSEAASFGENCKFYGRTTGQSTGYVSSVVFTANVGGKVFKNQILYQGVTKGGDSGSVVYNLSNNAIGMIFAASTDQSQGLANQIADVLHDLGGLTIAK